MDRDVARRRPSGLGVVRLLSDRWSSHCDGLFTAWFEIDVTTTLSRSIPVELAESA
jgi:hypothetical protein